jgi:hypothetical protein
MKHILTLTTIPTRLIGPEAYECDIRYCIKSLLNQNHNDYEIHFNIPHRLKSNDDEYIIPEWLNELEIENDNLKIFRVEDQGPITKLLPTLDRCNDEDIIIVVDDDMVYHEELVNEHIKNREKWPDYVVGYDGISSRTEDGKPSDHFGDTRDHYYSANKRDSYVNVLQHYKSVSYCKHFFKDDLENFLNEYGVWNDDVTIAAYLAKHKIKRLVTYYENDPDCQTAEEWAKFVGNSFPIIKYTQHINDEGCNLNRKADGLTDELIKIGEERFNKLYSLIELGNDTISWSEV